MAKSKKPLLIPFVRLEDEEGYRLVTRVGNSLRPGMVPVEPACEYTKYISDKRLTWVPNFSFEAALEYIRYFQGRSSARLGFRVIAPLAVGNCPLDPLSDLTHIELTLHTFNSILQGPGIDGKMVPRTAWTFAKQGQNYQLVLHG